MQHLHTDRDYIFIGGKQTKQRSAEVIEYESQCQSRTKSHTKSDADTLFHAVIFSGTKILSYESRNSDTERIIDHPVERINLSESTPGGHCIGSQII